MDSIRKGSSFTHRCVLAIGVVTLCVGASLATPPNMPVVAAWGYNGDGGCNVPPTLTTAKRVAAGSFHSVSIAGDGSLVAWGYNGDGQCEVSDLIDDVVDVSCGGFFTVALTGDGTVICRGNNDFNQCEVPEGLVGVKQISAGDSHVLALTEDGSIIGWGYNEFGQTQAPAGLTDAAHLYAGGFHNVARRTDGSLVGWGYNVDGECNVPASLTTAADVAPGMFHTVALKPNGRVVGWGYNNYGQSSPPQDLAGVVSVASGAYHSAALRDDGFVLGWGYNRYGQCYQPPQVGSVTQLASGGYHLVAIYEGDCDANGTLDATDIASGEVDDLNGNLQPDTCDLARGFEEDCNDNGIVDSYDQQLYADATASSGILSVIGDGHPQQWVYENPSLSLDDPVITVRVRGDFSAPGETLTVTLNGHYLARIFTSGSDKNDCRAEMTRLIWMPRDVYNEFVRGPENTTIAIFDLTASVAVNADQCPTGSYCMVEIAYTAAVTGDCNANSLLDVCEIAEHPELDLNGDGVPDACQGSSLVFVCQGDLDGNHSVDAGDLSLLLVNFGRAMPGDPSDLDGDGIIGNPDISLLLLNFGQCQ